MQAREERARGLAVTPYMEGLENNQLKVMKSQLGFCSYVLEPLFAPLARLLPDCAAVAYEQLQANIEYYRAHSGADERLQANIRRGSRSSRDSRGSSDESRRDSYDTEGGV